MGRKASVGTVGHQDALDGMRAVAIGGVLLLHLDRAHFPGGAFGVDVFFVLSSYLISALLLEEFGRNGRIRFGAFYWRRFFRLYPALLLWLVVVAIPTAVLIHQAHTIPWSTTGAIFYFSDVLETWTSHVGAPFDQSWSLAVEEQFYLLWPVVLALITARFTWRGQRWATTVMIALSVVVWFLCGNYFLPTGHLVPLALGCWAAFWMARGGAETRLAAFLMDDRVAVAAVGVFVVALFWTPSGQTGDLLDLAVGLAATGLMIHGLLAARSWPSRVLGSSLFRWVGVRSYGIYLYGLTLLILVPTVTRLPLHEVAPLDLVVITAVVALSYRFVESPLRDRGRAWLARPHDGLAPTPEPEPDDLGEATDRAHRQTPIGSS